MKNKPVKKGYKFCEICCASTGFFYKALTDTIFVNPNKEGKKVIDITKNLI